MSRQTGNPQNIVHEVMGNVPVAGPGRTGMMGGGGGIVPPILLEESRVPRFYLDAIVACGATSAAMLPHTALVYNLMVTSGLPRSVLSYVWSAVNRSLPGQLTRPEFFSCLALIALAQKGESLAALSSMSQLPIPFLQSVQVPAQTMAPPIVNTTRTANTNTQRPVQAAKKEHQSSSFIPTSLLPSFRSSSQKKSQKKNVDLLGEVFQSAPATTANGDLIQQAMQAPQPTASHSISLEAQAPSTSQGERRPSAEPTTAEPAVSSKPNYDLGDIDWSSVGGSLLVTSSASAVCQSVPSSNGTVSSTSFSEEKREKRNESNDDWHSIVRAAVEKFRECDRLLAGAKPEIRRELFETERGEAYLRCLHHVYLVLSRVRKTIDRLKSIDISKEVKECDRIWRQLEQYLPD